MLILVWCPAPSFVGLLSVVCTTALHNWRQLTTRNCDSNTNNVMRAHANSIRWREKFFKIIWYKESLIGLCVETCHFPGNDKIIIL